MCIDFDLKICKMKLNTRCWSHHLKAHQRDVPESSKIDHLTSESLSLYTDSQKLSLTRWGPRESAPSSSWAIPQERRQHVTILSAAVKKKRRPNWKPANNTNNNNNNNNNKETLGVGYGQIQWVKAADTVWLLIPHHFLLFLERFFTSIVKSTCWSILSSIYEFHCRVNGARIHVATRFDSM